MSTPVSIRRFGPREWRSYCELRLRSLEESPDAFGRTLEEEKARSDEAWATRLASASTFDLPLVAEANGQMVGLAWGRIEAKSADTARLFQMWVAPDHRRHGIGQMLLDAVIRWAAAAGAREIALAAACGDTPAMRLYLRSGFEPAGAPEPIRPGSTHLSLPMRLAIKGLESNGLK